MMKTPNVCTRARAAVVTLILLAAPCGAAAQQAQQPRARELAEAERLLEQVLELYKAGRHAEALPLAERALEARERLLGARHADVLDAYVVVSTLLNQLAVAAQDEGDMARAEPLYLRSLAMREKALGPDHPRVATALGNLADLYERAGDLTRAEPLYVRALGIYERVIASDDTGAAEAVPFAVRLLNNMGRFYAARGDYKRAMAHLGRVFDLGARKRDMPDLVYAPTYEQLSKVLAVGGLFDEAEKMASRAVLIRERFQGDAHPEIALALNELALVLTERGEYARAEPLFRKSLAISEKAFGPTHTEVATLVNNLALLYSRRGDHALAEPLYRRALSIYEQALGEHHPNVAATLNNLFSLHLAAGDAARALSAAERAAEVRERNLSLVLAAGSEQQKLYYAQTLEGETSGIVTFHARQPADARAARFALTTLLRRKGRALDAMAEGIGALRRRAGAEERKLLDELAGVTARLAALQLGSGEAVDAAARKAQAARLEAEKERLEAQVSERSREFRARAQAVSLEAVRQTIPAGAALVEFVAYRPFDPKAGRERQYGPTRYAAYVLRREGEPSFAELGGAAEAEAEIRLLRAALVNPRSQDVKKHARALDERVMRPVRALLGDARHVFLSPDGGLNLVPFAALVDEQDRYLAESYTFTHLTSGRDLLRLQLTGESRQTPLVIADPHFDGESRTADAARGGAGEAANRRSADMAEMRFGPLPGTAGEAKEIGPLLNVAPLTRAEATEAALKRASAPQVLHVATHGFFLSDQKQDASAEARNLGLGSGVVGRENPLLRSGLALAGANARAGGAGEDGVLTALEAAGLDLWGTKLVVLSACETGVGQVENGEGVYGLRRALVLAGAESQVMSLWQVSDDATRELMIGYYKRLQAGEGRTEALRQAQLEMLRGGGAPKQPAQPPARQGGLAGALGSRPADRTHPYFWAAFIQSGDWRPMAARPGASK
jgi:CHAT domain-containing protein/Tfp pilus assembly protein PilF